MSKRFEGEGDSSLRVAQCESRFIPRLHNSSRSTRGVNPLPHFQSRRATEEPHRSYDTEMSALRNHSAFFAPFFFPSPAPPSGDVSVNGDLSNVIPSPVTRGSLASDSVFIKRVDISVLVFAYAAS